MKNQLIDAKSSTKSTTYKDKEGQGQSIPPGVHCGVTLMLRSEFVLQKEKSSKKVEE